MSGSTRNIRRFGARSALRKRARNGHDVTWSGANPNSKQLKQARAGAYRSRREKQPRKILDLAYLALRKIRKGISGICGAPGARDSQKDAPFVSLNRLVK